MWVCIDKKANHFTNKLGSFEYDILSTSKSKISNTTLDPGKT